VHEGERVPRAGARRLQRDCAFEIALRGGKQRGRGPRVGLGVTHPALVAQRAAELEGRRAARVEDERVDGPREAILEAAGRDHRVAREPRSAQGDDAAEHGGVHPPRVARRRERRERVGGAVRVLHRHRIVLACQCPRAPHRGLGASERGPGGRVGRPAPRLPQPDLVADALAEEAGDLADERVARGERVAGGLREARPAEVGAGAAVDQADAHPQPPPDRLDGAADDGARAERRGNAVGGRLRAPERGHAVARHDVELLHGRQLCDQLLGETVGDGGQPGVRAEVVEVQHGDAAGREGVVTSPGAAGTAEAPRGRAGTQRGDGHGGGDPSPAPRRAHGGRAGRPRGAPPRPRPAVVRPQAPAGRLQRVLERVGELGGGCEPVGRLLRERAQHRVLDLVGDRAPHHGERRDVVEHLAGDDRLGRRADERRLPGQHLVQHAAERVDVAPSVERPLAHGLLGAHVHRRPQRQPGLRQPPLGARLAHRAGDPEVGEQHPVALEQDVLGLDVAVDDSLRVRVGERAGDAAGDPHGHLHGEHPLPLHAGRQRLAPRRTASRSTARRPRRRSPRSGGCRGA
jgi:hypothetical protein